MLAPRLNEGRQLERRLDWCEPGVVAGSPAQRVLRPRGRLGHSPELRTEKSDTTRGVLAGLPEYPQSQASDAPLPHYSSWRSRIASVRKKRRVRAWMAGANWRRARGREPSALRAL